jgi:hypothetical protein
MNQITPKRRLCSYDMVEVAAEAYVLAEEQGHMYFCDARCLCLWAVHFVTNPRRSEEQKRIACEMTTPSGERRKFTDFIEAAQWSAANALEGASNPWLDNGTPLD